MTSFSSTVLSYEDLLRALADAQDGDAALTPKEMAARLGRVASNLVRDLKKLREEGVITPEPAFALTERGRQVLLGLDVAAGRRSAPEADPSAPRLEVLHAQISRDPANPRTVFADEDLAELATSIEELGLIEPLVLRDLGSGAYRLIAGERRWRAIGILIEGGAWDPATPVPVVIKAVDDRQAALMALVENLQRVDLDKIEEAEALERLNKEFGLSTGDIASKIGRTQRFVQRRLLLTGLDAEGKRLLREKVISVEEAEERLKDPKHNLTPQQALVLVEIAHKVLTQPAGKTYQQVPVCRARCSQSTPVFAELYKASLVAQSYTPEGAYLTADGTSLLKRLDLHPEANTQALQRAREAAGCTERQLAKREAEGGYVTDWLNPVFTPAMRLALIEMAWLTEQRGLCLKGKTGVLLDGYPGNDATGKDLEREGLVTLGSGHHEGQWRYWAQPTADGMRKTVEILSGRKPSAVIDEEVARAFTISPTEIADRRKVSGAVTPLLAHTSVVKSIRDARAKKEREAALKREAATILEDTKAACSTTALPETFATLLQRVRCKAPWSVDAKHGNRINDSEGREVLMIGAWQADAASQAKALIVATAINRLCGVYADDEAAAPDRTAEAQYVTRIAWRLASQHGVREAACIGLARRIHQAELERVGIVFGDPDYSWTEADADQCADDGIGDVREDEEAA